MQTWMRNQIELPDLRWSVQKLPQGAKSEARSMQKDGISRVE
jgi:hypothetical protein